MPHERKHDWSGWPGAFCLRCGIGDPLEHALASDWYDCGPGMPETWVSEDHKHLVELISGTCPTKVPAEEFEPINKEIGDLIEKLGVNDVKSKD